MNSSIFAGLRAPIKRLAGCWIVVCSCALLPAIARDPFESDALPWSSTVEPHGMQGTSCFEVLTCHVEFLPPLCASPAPPMEHLDLILRKCGICKDERDFILAEGAIALLVTLSGSALFAS